MSPVKVAAIVLVIATGLAGSYFIVKNSIPPVQAPPVGEVTQAGKPLTQNPVQWIKDATKFLTESSKNLANSGSFLAEAGDSVKTENNNSINLTKLVAGTMFGQMRNLDQSDKNPFQDQGFDMNNPESHKAIQETLSNFKSPSLFFGKSISDKDLKISQDNSVEARSNYLMTTGKIILDNSNEVYNNPVKALEKFVNESDASMVSELADTYSKIYRGFLKTPVPSDWLDLHKRYVTFLKNAEMIYRGIADFQNDPLKSQLFIQLVSDMTNIELGLKQEFYEKSLNFDS